MESSAENSLSMVVQSDKNITKMMVRQQKRNDSKAGARRVKGKASCLPIQKELNDNP